jgi:hypothetical protein
MYANISTCTTEFKNENLYDLYIIRGIIMFFPIQNFESFFIEFKWMYRSWIEMQIYESKKWRTDLVVFIDGKNLSKNELEKFHRLNCTFNNIRQNKIDLPLCSLISFTPLAKRVFNKIDSVDYDYLFKNFDIFDESEINLNNFYSKIKDISHYDYTDSILIAFDGFQRLNKFYDILLRTDMDTFLTPMFGQYMPKQCGDFIVGSGAYSNSFNLNRLKRISKDINLENALIYDLGSTWYSTPKQFRLVSYFTLISMTYLSNEEFTTIERELKLGNLLWPEWHYGLKRLFYFNFYFTMLFLF